MTYAEVYKIKHGRCSITKKLLYFLLSLFFDYRNIDDDGVAFILSPHDLSHLGDTINILNTGIRKLGCNDVFKNGFLFIYYKS